MAKNKATRFKIGDQVVLRHSVCGFYENMIGYVSNATSNRNEEIKVTIDDIDTLIKTKYIDFPKPNRFSSKFNIWDRAIVKRHYGRFTEGSRVTVLSNYLGTNNKLVVQDERKYTGEVSEPILLRA